MIIINLHPQILSPFAPLPQKNWINNSLHNKATKNHVSTDCDVIQIQGPLTRWILTVGSFHLTKWILTVGSFHLTRELPLDQVDPLTVGSFH